MKSLALVAVNQVECHNIQEPIPEANRAKIKVDCCGICGSDPHIVLGMLEEVCHV